MTFYCNVRKRAPCRKNILLQEVELPNVLSIVFCKVVFRCRFIITSTDVELDCLQIYVEISCLIHVE